MEEKKEHSEMNLHKTYKKRILLFAGATVAITAVVLGIKNKDTLLGLGSDLKDAFIERISGVKGDVPLLISDNTNDINKSKATGLPFVVHMHIRNLPEGRHASPTQIDKASEYGITLGERQTLVDSYYKRLTAA